MLASHLYLDSIMKLFTVLNLNQQHMGKHADVTWHWTGVPAAIFQSSLRTFSCSKAGHQTSIAGIAALEKKWEHRVQADFCDEPNTFILVFNHKTGILFCLCPSLTFTQTEIFAKYRPDQKFKTT